MNIAEVTGALEKLGFTDVAIEKVGWVYVVEAELCGIRFGRAHPNLDEVFGWLADDGVKTKAGMANAARAQTIWDEDRRSAGVDNGPAVRRILEQAKPRTEAPPARDRVISAALPMDVSDGSLEQEIIDGASAGVATETGEA